MNKIIVGQQDLYLQEEEGMIEIVSKDLTLHIKNKVSLGIKEIADGVHIKIYIEKESQFTFSFLGVLNNNKNTIEIYSSDSSFLQFCFACSYEGKNELHVFNYLNGSNISNTLLFRTVEQNGTLMLRATGIIKENTNDNTYLEDIRALTNRNNSIQIKPDLFVKSNSVVANHNATISGLEEDSLLYLKSKGIKQEEAISLLKEGFLKSIIPLEIFKE